MLAGARIQNPDLVLLPAPGGAPAGLVESFDSLFEPASKDNEARLAAFKLAGAADQQQWYKLVMENLYPPRV